MRFFLALGAMFGLLWGQITVLTQSPFPSAFDERRFAPSLHLERTGVFYFLDRDSRQIAGLFPDGQSIFSGGLGTGEEAMFTPLDLAMDDLTILICDQSENRILRFDRRLNYLDSFSTVSTPDNIPLYPEFIDVNPWGQIFIYSEEAHKIYQKTSRGFEEFVDLNPHGNSPRCIGAMDINKNGDIGLLYDCTDDLHVYNRLGRLVSREKVKIFDPEFLIDSKIGWLVLNENGQGQVLDHGMGEFTLPEGIGAIQDIIPEKNGIGILTPKKQVSLVFDTGP